MHPIATDLIVKEIRQRASEGDCPTVPARSVGQLEDVIIDLASRLALATPSRDPAQQAREAKAEIERQRTSVPDLDVLTGALGPFADLCDYTLRGHRDDRPVLHGIDHHILEQITVGDLRKAKAALSASPQQGQDAGMRERAARIADPWPAIGPPETEVDKAVVEVRTKIAASIRALEVSQKAAPATAAYPDLNDAAHAEPPPKDGAYLEGLDRLLSPSPPSPAVEPLIQKWRNKAIELRLRINEMETTEEAAMECVDSERLDSCANELFVALFHSQEEGSGT